MKKKEFLQVENKIACIIKIQKTDKGKIWRLKSPMLSPLRTYQNREVPKILIPKITESECLSQGLSCLNPTLEKRKVII